MKVLLVNTFYYPEIEGGAEYSIKILAEKLKDLGHDVNVLCTYNSNSIDDINGIKVYRFKSNCIYRMKEYAGKSSIKRKIHRALDVYNLFNYKVLKRYISAIKPDIIHTNGLYDISPIIWRVSKNLNIPVVHTLRDYYLICNNGNLLHRKNNTHCDNPNLICFFYRKYNIIASNNVDFVTAPSEKTLDIITQYGLFKKSKKRMVLNASELNISLLSNMYNYRKNANEDEFVFLYLGTLAEHKGVKWLIDSFKSIHRNNIKLIICGKGPLIQYVNEETSVDNRILYKGFLKQDEINEVLKKTYMLICPSLWDEPFGRVVLDAYNMDVPVIGTTYGALPSIIENRVTGLIVDPKNKNSLKEAINESIDNKTLYSTMIGNIPDYVKKFSVQSQAEQFIDIYTTCSKMKA